MKKRILVLAILATLGIGAVSAAWVASITGQSKAVITSGAPITWTSGMDVNNLDITGANTTTVISDDITIENNNDGNAADIDFNCTTTYTTTDVECTDEDIEVVLPSDFELGAGATEVKSITYTVDPWDCPAEITNDCTITGTKV